MSKALLTVAIHYEQDVVVARQRARQIAALVGFDGQDQTRIATAVSEIARNAFRYAGGGRVEFALEGESAPQLLVVRVSDKGPGIEDVERILSGRYRSSTGMGIGLIGAHRLMDRVEIRTAPGAGTDVTLRKMLPPRAPLITALRVNELVQELTTKPPVGAHEELQQQNQELLRALSELRERQEELMHLNRELEDTNRGVVALYAELDEKADHLRRADEMKSKFLSNMSHEFRTPLNSIRALSKILLDQLDGPLTAEQDKQVRFIAKAADDLTELVNDLLDLAKIEAGKIEVRPVEFEVANLFSALRGMLRPLLVSDDVKLVFEDPPASLVMYNDEGKVSQILRNFISNAIKFTERGEVRVTATPSADGRRVVLSVTDTGIGIREEDQAGIFEEFTQVANPLQGRVKGTGLGLPLCRRLARLMHGEVDVESRFGVGSTFTATLPLYYDDRVSAATVTSPLEVELDPALVPVLIVEDEPETQFIYAKLLKNTRYQPLAARTLREAREIMSRVRPRCVILDVLLRGEDSWRWLNELKTNPETASVPVLMATKVEDERKALALGADSYFVKPLSRVALLDRLNTLVGRDVLVIDDDPAARYLLQKLIGDNRTRVIEAEDGHSGLRAARAARPAMIFLDLQLPDSNGEDVLGAIRRDSDLRQVPVAIVTSRSLSDEERSRLGEQAQAVLQKSELNADTARAILSRNGL
ncbi:MAG TPA: ATP-binding protein [Steroidobacteraceae bacterium]|nr:ATP-binding protein [Steroidobacteraceae bacterium]